VNSEKEKIMGKFIGKSENGLRRKDFFLLYLSGKNCFVCQYRDTLF